jgi:hypothetical protein
MLRKVKLTRWCSLVLALTACHKNNSALQPKKACEFKDQICDTSLFYLGNKTSDTIYFSFGSNFFNDTLVPDEVKIFKKGKVKVTYDTKTCEKKRTSWSTPTINSNKGSWAYHQDHCAKVSNFKYDNGTSGHVSLYDDTQ